ncbi:MAG TPA: 6-carboxytetrahydropterin synthase [Bryobacteraceae bacterium]|nr:6-carboxytetrahydropterin synthase [Bryobacteraceae bacterium]
MLISRRAEFSASHICRNTQLSEEENVRLYGPGANAMGHGHNYILEVTLEGSPDPATGMIYDLKDLKDVMLREVVDPMDHRHLNYEVPPFDKVIPTTENLAVEIWRRLEPQFAGTPAKLHTVRLYDTEDTFVDYRGK